MTQRASSSTQPKPNLGSSHQHPEPQCTQCPHSEPLPCARSNAGSILTHCGDYSIIVLLSTPNPTPTAHTTTATSKSAPSSPRPPQLLRPALPDFLFFGPSQAPSCQGSAQAAPCAWPSTPGDSRGGVGSALDRESAGPLWSPALVTTELKPTPGADAVSWEPMCVHRPRDSHSDLCPPPPRPPSYTPVLLPASASCLAVQIMSFNIIRFWYAPAPTSGLPVTIGITTDAQGSTHLARPPDGLSGYALGPPFLCPTTSFLGPP